MNSTRTNDPIARTRTGSTGSGRSGGRFGSSAVSRFGGPSRSGGYDRPAAVHGEFALPRTITPALPAVDDFADLDMPGALLAALGAQGVTVPFPIQAATLPNTSPVGTSWAVAAPAPARPSPSGWRCWPARPGSVPRPGSRWG
jgi:hypothetical protein